MGGDGSMIPMAALTKLQPAHLADHLPLVRRDRLHRQPRIFHQRHGGELLFGLDRGHRHRRLQRLVGLDVDADEFAGLVGRIRIGLLDDLGDPDDLLSFVGMIEEGAVALLHVHEILPGGEIAHPGPGLALGAFCNLLVPRPGRRLGFHQPVVHDAHHFFVMAGLVPAIHVLIHVIIKTWMPATSAGMTRRNHSSALNGRVSRPSIAASIVIFPLKIAATAFDTGISTSCEAASSTSTGAVNSPSASLPGAGRSPRPSAMPSAKLRDCGLEQVRIKSPNPDSPISVSPRAPQARPSRASSLKPRVVSAASAEAPSLRPETIPAAIASPFFAAPPISTPRTSDV